jgi:uncharacterized cupredoxin-like copper-binding protein
MDHPGATRAGHPRKESREESRQGERESIMRRWGAVLGAVAALALASVACSSGSSPSGTASRNGKVSVGLTEYKITPDVQTVKAGTVTFDVTNDGTTPHEMVLIKTGVAPTEIPMQNGKASETGSVGEVADLEVGITGTLKVNLSPGTYVMICNLPGHYTAGMATEFTVS